VPDAAEPDMRTAAPSFEKCRTVETMQSQTAAIQACQSEGNLHNTKFALLAIALHAALRSTLQWHAASCCKRGPRKSALVKACWLKTKMMLQRLVANIILCQESVIKFIQKPLTKDIIHR
jgi:hypothetical protein